MVAEITHTSSHHGYYSSSRCIRRLILDIRLFRSSENGSYQPIQRAVIPKDVERLVNGTRLNDKNIRDSSIFTLDSDEYIEDGKVNKKLNGY